MLLCWRDFGFDATCKPDRFNIPAKVLNTETTKTNQRRWRRDRAIRKELCNSRLFIMSFCQLALVFKAVCTKLSNIVPSWPTPFWSFFSLSYYCDAIDRLILKWADVFSRSHNYYPRQGKTLGLADVSPAIPSAWLISAQQYPQLGWYQLSNTLSIFLTELWQPATQYRQNKILCWFRIRWKKCYNVHPKIAKEGIFLTVLWRPAPDKTKFDADSVSIEKKLKCSPKNSYRPKTFAHSNKSKIIYFFCIHFCCSCFNGFEVCIKFCFFLYTIVFLP
jgi:hypothetical protein